MLSISTSWNHTPDASMRTWLAQVRDLGFSHVELGYTITHRQFEEFLGTFRKVKMKVSSIHNFCPIPDDEPSSRHPSNYYRLSALDEHERHKAIEWTNNTIDNALQVGAEVVIIHAGTIELEDDPSKQLFELYRSGQNNSKEFKEMRTQLLKLREEKKGPHIEALKISLKEVMNHAQLKRIKIGLETRYYPMEIPNFEEIGYFLKIFEEQGMYYWHDVGHAEVNERLGIKPHLEFLKTYQSKMLGMHIHGIKELRDHLAPFDGDMDLMKALKFMRDDMIQVIEARIATLEQIKAAIARLP